MFFTSICRKTGTDRLNAALSEQTRTTRRRTNSVNVKITFMSWILEFLTGLSFIIDTMTSHGTDSGLFIDSCLNFILIPGTFVINHGVTKNIIVQENWCQGLRNIMGRYDRVELILQNQVMPNAQPNLNARPIRAISRNIVPLPCQNLSSFQPNNSRSRSETENPIGPVHRNVNCCVENGPDETDSMPRRPETTESRNVPLNVRQQAENIPEIILLPGEVQYISNCSS